MNSFKDTICRAYGSQLEMFLDIDACMPFQCKICSMHPCKARQEQQSGSLTWNVANVSKDAKHGLPEEELIKR